MSSIATSYRNNHPEYREKERTKWREIENNRYKEDEEYKQKKRAQALAYYYRKKAAKAAQATEATKAS